MNQHNQDGEMESGQDEKEFPEGAELAAEERAARQAGDGGEAMDDGAEAAPDGIESGPDDGGEQGTGDETLDPEERIALLESQLGDQRDALLRTLAEMDNLRKRTAREKESARKFALEGFSKDLLQVADNLDRALEAIDQGQEGEGGEAGLKSLLEGVEMTRNQLAQVFAKHGVTRIEALNQPFDPNLHQAMMTVAHEGAESGTVVQELQTGYLIHDRLLRPAMVGVAQ